MFTPESKQDRLVRVATYFSDPELRNIITQGVSNKQPAQMTNYDVHAGLEEGVWSYNLLRFITNQTNDATLRATIVSRYINAIKNLQSRKYFFWPIDAPGNDWAPIWIRLIDRLRQSARKIEDIPAAAQEKIEEVYKTYKAEADQRRAKHVKTDGMFLQIFSALPYQALRERIVHPVTKEITPKHCDRYLLEIQNRQERLALIRTYFEALCTNKAIPLATQLVAYFEKHVKEYSNEYQGEIPREVHELATACIQRFKS